MKKNKIKIEITNHSIYSDSDVKVSTQGDIIEVTHTTAKPHEATIRKLSAKEYEVVSTGEIRQYETDENTTRGDDFKGLKRSMNKLRCLINTNVTHENFERVYWITLTYQENMQDTKKLYNDFVKFWKRFQYKYKEHDTAYIAAVEPQERGAWHFHVLIIFLGNTLVPALNKTIIRDLWNKNEYKCIMVDVEKVDGNIDNFGSYLCAYLTDAEVTENGDDVIIKDSKKIKKGARLHFYPKGINFYRTSKNIKKPTEKECKYYELQELNNCALTFKKSYDIKYDEQDDTKKISVIKEYYNTNRKEEDGIKHVIPKKASLLDDDKLMEQIKIYKEKKDSIDEITNKLNILVPYFPFHTYQCEKEFIGPRADYDEIYENEMDEFKKYMLEKQQAKNIIIPDVKSDDYYDLTF